MPLTSQPTKVDASIGRVKSDALAIDDIDTQVPAAEWERIKDFLIAVCDEAGVHVGTEGSLNTRTDELELPEVVDVNTTTRTMTAADRGKLFACRNGAGCEITVPDSLPDGWRAAFLQTTDPVTFVWSGAGGLIGIAEHEDTPFQSGGLNAIVRLEIASVVGTKVGKLSGELLRAADYVAQIGAADTTHAASHLPLGSDPLATAAPISLAIGAAGNEGNDESFARSDHEHAIPAPPAPAAVARANATGDDTTVARSDHVHDGGVISAADFDDTASPIALLSTHEVLTLDTGGGSIEIDLPSPASVGARTWTLIQRVGNAANDITLDPAGAESINGVAANFVLPGSDEDSVKAWLLVCDGSNWWVV
jgi:hypothetical protein